MWSTESSVSIESIEWVDPSYPFARLRIKYIPSFRRNRLFVESGSSVVIFNTHLRISSLYCIIPGIKSKRSVLLVVKILFVCWVWIKRCAQPSNLWGRIGGEQKKKEWSCVSVIAVLVARWSICKEAVESLLCGIHWNRIVFHSERASCIGCCYWTVGFILIPQEWTGIRLNREEALHYQQFIAQIRHRNEINQ